MILYIIAFSCFFHKVLEVFVQAFSIQIFRFFPLHFLKIIFIICVVQVIKGKCYNTKQSDHMNEPTMNE
jgi:hypothetical protein